LGAILWIYRTVSLPLKLRCFRTRPENGRKEVTVKNQSLSRMARAAVFASLLFATRPVSAQSAASKPPAAPAKPTPRASDGKPDLSGFWGGPLMHNMDKNVPGGFAAIFTPAGKEAFEYNLAKTTNPEGLCLFAGIPRASISGISFEILQNPTRVAFLYELMNTFRSIPVDGRDHPKEPVPSFFGNGIGKWEGETFIIDSIGFKDTQSWLDDDAHPHSDAMHVVERWTRTDASHTTHQVTVEDPKFYSKPFSFDRVFTHLPPGQELLEYACDENNIDRDGRHLGLGVR
jgi:hypothetical protein